MSEKPNSDQALMRRYIDFCIARDFTMERMGLLVGRRRQWASLVVNGHTKHLKFVTRNRIKKVLGEINESAPVEKIGS